MNPFLSRPGILQQAFLVILLVGSPTRAELQEYRTIPEKSSIVITGTSTLHDWEIKAAIDESALLLDLAQDESGPEIVQMAVTVPVRSMQSGKAGMDKNTYKALNADQFPRIMFNAIDRVSAQEGSEANGWRYTVSGRLSVMGENTPLSVPFLLEQTPDGGVLITGHTVFLMSDTGVTPPRAALGAIRTGDRIVVTFKWALLPTTSLP